MTDMSTESSHYDPKHPWLQNQEDDPRQANWSKVFFDPAGVTRKPVFLRAQTLLWIGRLVAYFLAGSIASGAFLMLPLGFEGNPAIALGVMFGLFLLFSVMSVISHIRRLNDSGRSPLWAMIIPIPLFVGAMAGMFSLIGGAAMTTATANDAAKAEIVAEAEPASEANDDADETASAADADQTPEPRRGGPPKKPPTAKDFVNGAMGAGFMVWAISGFFVMLFSLLFVARKPTTTRD